MSQSDSNVENPLLSDKHTSTGDGEQLFNADS